ncbi:MAG: hypothetical protein H0U29_01795 [Acidimicrobiia bacterium]|nr:hypothetical protein [Acidimicrobiia bacterium]
MTDTPSTTAADRLEAGVADVHVPEPSADSEALLLKVGFALPIVGVVLILVAWWQAAGSKFVADQIPMLISGGILGLALIIVGLGLFIRFSLARLLRFWLARLVVEQQAQTDRLVDAVGQVSGASGANPNGAAMDDSAQIDRLVDALSRVEVAIRDATTDAPVVVELSDSSVAHSKEPIGDRIRRSVHRDRD